MGEDVENILLADSGVGTMTSLKQNGASSISMRLISISRKSENQSITVTSWEGVQQALLEDPEGTMASAS